MTIDNGVISRPSRYPVSETISRLKQVLETKNIAIFAQIDQSAEAEKVGLSLRPVQLLIFGNPKAGTPLMVHAPLSAIDLPLKALAWEDEQGQVWLSYNAPAYLQQRFDLSDKLIENIAGTGALIELALV